MHETSNEIESFCVVNNAGTEDQEIKEFQIKDQPDLMICVCVCDNISIYIWNIKV